MNFITMDGKRARQTGPNIVIEEGVVAGIVNAALSHRGGPGCRLNESCASCIFQRANGSCY